METDRELPEAEKRDEPVIDPNHICTIACRPGIYHMINGIQVYVSYEAYCDD